MDTDGRRFFGRPPGNEILGMQIHDGPGRPVLDLKEVKLAFHETDLSAWRETPEYLCPSVSICGFGPSPMEA